MSPTPSRCAAWCPPRSPRSAVLDILVNNAFRALLVRSAQPQNLRLDRMVRLRGAARRLSQRLGQYNTCEGRAAARCDVRPRGRIINISSNLVHSPIVPYHDYTAAKGALVGLHARSLSAGGRRLGRDRERHRGRTDRGHRFESGHHRQPARAHHRLPRRLGRLATAEDIAGAVAMLAGDDAAFITGQTLHVDGGLVMR